VSQTLSYSSVVETGTGWSSGANVQTENGVGARCLLGSSSTSGWLKIALTNPVDPQDHTNHRTLVRAKKDSGTLSEYGLVTLEVSLRESGTERDNFTVANADIGTSFANFENLLSTTEAGNIGNYNNLEIWLRVTFDSGTLGTRGVDVDFLKMTIPDLAVPAQVTGVAASDGTFTDKVRVTWSSAARASTYKVLRNGVVIASGISGTTYDDTTATPAVTYAYSVKGTNSSGDGPESATNNGYRAPTLIAGTGVLLAGSSTVSGTGVSGSTGSGALQAEMATLFGFGTGFTGILVASQKAWNLKASHGD